MNISVQSRDERANEVLAMDLPIQQGAQLAVDITLRSALTTTGEPCPNGATTNGAAIQLAQHLKEAKYWELLEGDRCRLVVIGVETGGRFSPEAVNFVDALAASKSTRFSTSAATISTLGLATSVDADVGRLLWPFLRCFTGRRPERRVVWHRRLRPRFGRPFLGEVRGLCCCTDRVLVELFSAVSFTTKKPT